MIGKKNLDFDYDNDSTNARKPATYQRPPLEPAYMAASIDVKGRKTEKDFATATQLSRQQQEDTAAMTQHATGACTLSMHRNLNLDRKTQNGKDPNTTKDIKGHRHHDTTLPSQKKIKNKSGVQRFSGRKVEILDRPRGGPCSISGFSK